MAYVIRSTEQNAARGNDMETRALLHMLCFRNDYNDINGFAIDFFNDVTGMDNMALRLYDVQSKAAKSGPKDIGRELVTLFKNYVSDFRAYFVEEVLFLGSITSNVLEDDDVLTEFKYADLTDEAQRAVRISLIEECGNKSYIDDASVSAENIDAFLGEVTFVVSMATKEEYIRPLIKTTNVLVPTDRDLRAIFNEVRKAQVAIKTRSKVEGIEINHPSEAYNYSRVLERSDIELLVIQRLINKNPLEAGIPVSFVPVYRSLAEDEAEEKVEDCQHAVARQMFAASESSAFWKLLEQIVTVIESDGQADVEAVFHAINPKILSACKFLNPLSAQYFIAIVKDGLK